MTLSFSTKGQTLLSLQAIISKAKILPVKIINYFDWKKNREFCIKELESSLNEDLYIVRSSSIIEDTEISSNAGAFLSIKNVKKEQLQEKIDLVFKSYLTPNDKDEVLIQPLLINVKSSGVAFSHDPNTCSPYRIISLSEGSDTSRITSGYEKNLWQIAGDYNEFCEPYLKKVIAMVEELLSVFGNTPIDCEFAFTENKNKIDLWLLQARQLVLGSKPEPLSTQKERLNKIQGKIENGVGKHPFIVGEKAVYGVMPDWNPAEILGIRPKPLALSLYRELVTDSIWAYQRNNYGYRNLRSVPLIKDFYGLPYVDVRASFNSFIPASLNDTIAGKLVDKYLRNLLDQPALHDKVEFEIVLSCFSLDIEQQMSEKIGTCLTTEERKSFKDSLLNLTNNIINPKNGLWKLDARKIKTLEIRRNKILSSKMNNIEKIYWLLEDTKRYGTLPFAGLARAGFMAIQLLKSLLNLSIFSLDDYDRFLNSISTINKQLSYDRKTKSKEFFLEKYGHLRPGTYDILSPRYDEAPDLYFDWDAEDKTKSDNKKFAATQTQIEEIDKSLKSHNLNTNANDLLGFIRSGIELRELSKFHFTRNLSDALVLMAEVGRSNEISRDDLAFCNIKTFQEMHITASEDKKLMLSNIEVGKERYSHTKKLSLPPLISKSEDIWMFNWPKTEPNFITQKHVLAPVTSELTRELIEGSLVCIANADPGFDWLFSHSIAGLITAWGGANSHMAIRAGELGLPAVIGAGEVLYNKWSNAKLLDIDCAGRRVTVLE